MSHQQNITRIKAVYNCLGHLKDEVVFVGGATVSLYADRETHEVRPTDDVDIVVELWSHQEYAAIETQLRTMGFVNDQESGIICRYQVQGITVDVMPTGDVLGFSNRWYGEAYANAIIHAIDEQHHIKIFSSPFFLATKLEAFKGRGGDDGRLSTDFEDIVFLLNNRTTIWEELAHSPATIQEYLKHEFITMLHHPFFEEWVSAHLDHYEKSRFHYIQENLRDFISAAF